MLKRTLARRMRSSRRQVSAHFFVMTLPHSDACFVAAYPAATTEGLAGRAQQSLCFFRRRSPIDSLRQRQVSGVAHLAGWHAATNGGRSAGCSPITSSRTATAVPARVTTKAMDGGGGRLCPAELHDAASRFASWDAFNGHLEEQCRNRQGNVLRGHRESIGERFVRDREALKRPLPAPFDACDKQGTRVNSLSLVRYRTNDYSVPVAYGHQDRLDPWLCPRGGYRLRRRDHCPTPPFLRPGRYGLRSDPLPAFAGAQDRCPGSGRAASRMGTA